MKAPWVKNYYNGDGQFYIIPNFDTVVVGGTVYKGDYNEELDPKVSRETLAASPCLNPSLARSSSKVLERKTLLSEGSYPGPKTAAKAHWPMQA